MIRLCLLVIVEVTEHSHKALVAIEDGFRPIVVISAVLGTQNCKCTKHGTKINAA